MPEASDARVLALLRPWGALLAQQSYAVGLTNAQRIDLGVELTLGVDVSAMAIKEAEEHDTSKLRELRELLDVIAMVAHHNQQLLWEVLPVALDEATTKALRRGAALHVRVVLEAKRLPTTAHLKQVLGELLLAPLPQALSTAAALLALRQDIGSNTIPVSIVLDVSTVGDKDPQAIQHLVELVQFAYAHRELRREDGVVSPHEPGTRTPLHVEKILFTPHQFILTPNALDCIHGLLDGKEGFFQCSYVSCDAQGLAHFSTQLTSLYDALSRGAPEGIVINPHDADRNEAKTLHAFQCEALIRSAAECERVREVRLGGLLDACTEDDQRGVFFRTVVDAILARAVPISLSIDTKKLKPCDVRLLREARARVRDAALRVETLYLEVPFRHQAFVLSVFDVVDEIKSLVMAGVNNAFGPPVSRAMLETLVARFPALEEMDLTYVDLDSFDVFIDGPCQKLQSITLFDLILGNRGSLLRFFEGLADPTTRLAQTLRHVRLANSGMQRLTFRLNTVEANALADALTNNTVLESVHVCIEDTQDHVSEHLRRRFKQLHGQQLLIPALEQRTNDQPKKARLAFLSCLQAQQAAHHSLEAAIVQLVLDFAAPWKERVVKVDWYTPPHTVHAVQANNE